jgi:excisionase family DNA binding protein
MKSNLSRRGLKTLDEASNFISTREAAEITGYAQDHVALLLRKGVLRGKKPARDWLVEKASLYEYLKQPPRRGRKSA